MICTLLCRLRSSGSRALRTDRLNTPCAVGPPKQVLKSLDSINTSSGAVWGVVDAKEVPETSFPVWTDVRDIAKIHVLGATEEVAKGKRCVPPSL